MEWSGQQKFVASSEVPFEVDGSKAGVLKNYGPLSFLKVSLSLSLSLSYTHTHTLTHIAFLLANRKWLVASADIVA